MCAIGRNQDTSIGAQAPATAMLGTGAVGTSATPGIRSTLLTGAARGPAAGPAAGSAAGGTILAPKTRTLPRKLEMMEP